MTGMNLLPSLSPLAAAPAPWRGACRLGLCLGAALVLASCAPLGQAPAQPPAPEAVTPAQWPETLARLLPTDALVLGEQHDAPEHQALQRTTVEWLARRGALAALVLEMAERGHSTQGLPADASEADVRNALHWNDAAWPWRAYGPVVMAAVRAGAVVHGGNLPRSQMRATMAEPHWEQHLPPQALQRQFTALRDGHCGLLPEAQIAPMARIQIARDASLAAVTRAVRQQGRTVLLVTGNGHALRSLGVPTHWGTPEAAPTASQGKKWVLKVALAQSGKAPEAIKKEADVVIETAALPPSDPCAALREQWQARPPAPIHRQP